MKAVAKHSYIRGAKGVARAQAHVKYLQHRPGGDREERKFFDDKRDAISGSEVRRAIAEQEERGVVLHKLILSPGCEGVDLERYTRETMREFGRSKGLDLEWKAIVHRNTDHEHVHIAIMGKDKNGRQVRFDGVQDYQKLREIQNRYLEREHQFERYLDREMHDLLKERGYSRDGDREFRRLIQDVTGPVREPNERKRAEKSRQDDEFRKFDKDIKLMLRDGEIQRRLSRGEVVRRQQGRMQEYHADYQAVMAKRYWKDLAERDPSQRQAVEQQLDFIDKWQKERQEDNRWRDLDELFGERHRRPDADRQRDLTQERTTGDNQRQQQIIQQQDEQRQQAAEHYRQHQEFRQYTEGERKRGDDDETGGQH